MITAIGIENFKAVGKRQRLELKPLTLLFGPNSAGKSTVIQAIAYAREVFDRHNLDADRTESNNLAESMPDQVFKMEQQWHALLIEFRRVTPQVTEIEDQLKVTTENLE